MAKILTTKGISSSIEELIRSARKELTIVSPYLQISEEFEKRFQDLIKRGGPQIVFIYGKRKENEDTRNFFMENSSDIDVYFNEKLHAKCYMNEDTAIITSMNLYEASEKNRELGVLIEKNCDRVLYDTTRDEVESIKNNSERKRFKNADVSPGYCIRCGAKIPFDPERPYCRSCFGVWAQYGDETYPEHFCHYCGGKADTTMLKPLELSCYRKQMW